MTGSERRFGRRRAFGLALPIIAWGLALAPARLAGAEGYAGSEACGDCHDEVVAAFPNTAHGLLHGGRDGVQDCESCHGPGQAHVDAGGEGLILSGKSDGVTSNCMACHGSDRTAHWTASTHDEFGVQCAECHRVHRDWTALDRERNEQSTETCLSCHQDMRKHLYQRSSHPLREGLMSCVTCHDPHGSTADAGVAALTPNDKCYECHAEKRGPFLFEHQPVREDCMTCHDPHGSNQTMMLQTAAPRLCQSCHMFGHHQTVPGEPTQVWNQNRSCTNCHYRIHGSNHPSGVMLLR